MWRRLRKLTSSINARFFQRAPIDTVPFVAAQNRVYIFPTPMGFALSAASGLFFAFALNYNNNLSLLTGSLLACLAVYGFMDGSCRRIVLEAVDVLPAIAGQSPGALRLDFRHTTGPAPSHPVYDLDVAGQRTPILFSAAGRASVEISFGAQECALLNTPKLLIGTRWPYALHRTWFRIKLPTVLPVIPSPLDAHVSPGEQPFGQSRSPLGAPDAIDGIRPVRPEESGQRLAWRPSLKHNRPITYIWDGDAGHAVRIPWPSTDIPLQAQCAQALAAADHAISEGLRFCFVIDGADTPAGRDRSHAARHIGAHMAASMASTPWPEHADA